MKFNLVAILILLIPFVGAYQLPDTSMSSGANITFDGGWVNNASFNNSTMLLITVPGVLIDGSMYYNLTDNKIYVYDGGWIKTVALT